MSKSRPPLILIVDDNAQNLKFLSSMLLKNGFLVETATSGSTALAKTYENHPDIILLDIMMPQLSGFDVCNILKNNQETSNIPILFISALSDSFNKIKGFEVGGTDFITKPFNKDEVLARIKIHLDLRNAMETIVTKNHELQELNSLKDKLFTIIGHDLKAYFNSLICTAELFSTSIDSMEKNELREVALEMKKTVTSMYNLLENLLYWARFKRGMLKYAPVPIHLKKLFDECIELSLSSLKQKGLTIDSQIHETIQVYADYNMIGTVIRNLISNAIKYSLPDGCITIQSKTLPNCFIEVTVADNGIGMSEDTQLNIFSFENKTSTPGTSNEKGTGIGLIVCKEFIEIHGGTLTVESKLGEGSLFRFTLPENLG